MKPPQDPDQVKNVGVVEDPNAKAQDSGWFASTFFGSLFDSKSEPAAAAEPSPAEEGKDESALSALTGVAQAYLSVLTGEQKGPAYFDPFNPDVAAGFRRVDSQVHRTLLAVGILAPLPTVFDLEYAPVYAVTSDAAAESLFGAGEVAIVTPLLRALPFADLAIEVVVVNGSVLADAASSTTVRTARSEAPARSRLPASDRRGLPDLTRADPAVDDGRLRTPL